MKAIFPLLLMVSFQYGVAQHFFGADKFLNSYTRYRLRFRCLGFINMKNLSIAIIDAFEECLEDPDSDIKAMLMGGLGMTMDTSAEKDTQVPMIQKPMYSKFLVRLIKNELVGRTDASSCWMKKLGFIDEEENLIYDNIVQGTKDFKLDPKLEKDILDGLTYCKYLSDFLPPIHLTTVLSPNMKKTMTFMKCKDELTDMACFKNDMRMSKDAVDLSGLDGFLSNLDDTEKKMAVVWSNIMMNALAQEYEVIF